MTHPPHPDPPTSDRYRTIRDIGSGGMATVYLADDLKHNRRVAVKVMKPALALAIGRERFLREIEVVARLNHPHIVPLFDSGASGEDLFYVMPYVEGESLRARISREPMLPVNEALRLTREIASALGHAHQHGLVHRDVKPENILIGDGMALVADFGIVYSAGLSDTDRTQVATLGWRHRRNADLHEPRAGLRRTRWRDVRHLLNGLRPFRNAHRQTAVRGHKFGIAGPNALDGDAPCGTRAASGRSGRRCACRRSSAFEAPGRTICNGRTACRSARRCCRRGFNADAAARRRRAPPNNLPAQRTHFIGRDHELAECARLLGDTRVLTLTGIGGCGKTRLAIKLAEQMLSAFPDGVWFVDLAPVEREAASSRGASAPVGGGDGGGRL